MEAVEGKAKSYDEKLAALDGLDGAKVKKINDFLDAQEEKKQELVKKEAEARKEAEELKERMADLEKAVVKKADSGEKNYKESAEYKSLMAYAVKGKEALFDGDVKAYLRTDSNTQGGYLVPTMMANEILKEIEEISPVRSFARVRSTQTKSLDIPVRDSIPTAAYEGEAASVTSSTQSYKSETMTAYRQAVAVPATLDILNFAGFDLMSEIGQDAARAFAKNEGAKFIGGSGAGEPEGILTNGDVATTSTAAAGAVSLDDVIGLAGELKEGYNPIYFFNRSTLYNLRTEKDGSGNYLWQIGGERMPNQINGFNYSIMQDMEDDDTTGNLPVGFGDLFMGYNILDSVQMSMLRDDFTKADEAMSVFHWRRWNTGQVVLPEAIKLLKVS
jgi:HK97 family phage major capsid protein